VSPTTRKTKASAKRAVRKNQAHLTTKDLRWNIRVAPTDDEFVRWAASASDRNYTDFIRAAAVKEAQQVLADRRTFQLDERQWNQFAERLDERPRIPEGLRDLFSKPSVFD
jgi:uncharacterized protein (DUF1778 family)